MHRADISRDPRDAARCRMSGTAPVARTTQRIRRSADRATERRRRRHCTPMGRSDSCAASRVVIAPNIPRTLLYAHTTCAPAFPSAPRRAVRTAASAAGGRAALEKPGRSRVKPRPVQRPAWRTTSRPWLTVRSLAAERRKGGACSSQAAAATGDFDMGERAYYGPARSLASNGGPDVP